MDVEATAPFEAVNEVGTPTLVGTIAVKVIDNVGGTPLGPTTADISEVSPGIYVWEAAAAPAALGQYTIIWSTDGTFDEDTVSTEALNVVPAGSVAPSPIPVPDDATATEGPCTAWITGDDVAECCGEAVAQVGTATVLLDDAADVASQLLYELSGRRWVGLCSRTGVRPCHSNCGCGWQVLSRGHVVAAWDSWSCEGRSCGCRDLSRVKLSGYVREVTQVKVGGVVVDPSLYRVDEHKWLTRLDGDRWPACGRLDLPDTEEGTFSVNYTFGKTPPLAGVEAAKQLACQIFMRCSNAANATDCAIPEGAVRISRQGITVERAIFARNPKTGAWETGLSAVDQFLNTYNPKGIMRRAHFISPKSSDRYARPVG